MKQVIKLKCLGCKAPISTEQKKCIYCGIAIVIESISSVQSMKPSELNNYANAYREVLSENPDNQEINTSLGFCYLKLELYDEAIDAFEKAMKNNTDNPEPFFYAAVSLLKGQKAFVAPRPNIDKIEKYINAALKIEPKGIYYYFQAYIKQDYFHRKFLNTTPTWEKALQTAIDYGITEEEVNMLFDILAVEIPGKLAIA